MQIQTPSKFESELDMDGMFSSFVLYVFCRAKSLLNMYILIDAGRAAGPGSVLCPLDTRPLYGKSPE